MASVTDELRPAVEQVEAAFAAVQSAVDGTTTDNLKDQAPGIAGALQVRAWTPR